MSGIAVRPATTGDRQAIRAVEESAFGRADEADLVEALVAAGDDVLELVAERGAHIIGHILFSRLTVETEAARVPAVALAPLAVMQEHQGAGIGTMLIKASHRLLRDRGEVLSVVLGHAAYYPRFGYAHERAAGFDTIFQCDELMALAFGEAPMSGRLVYGPAFGVETAG